MISREQARTALCAALVIICVGVLALAAGPLATLPVLLAFVPLLAGRYLGADALAQLIEFVVLGYEEEPYLRFSATERCRSTSVRPRPT